MGRWPFIIGAISIGCLVVIGARVWKFMSEPWGFTIG